MCQTMHRDINHADMYRSLASGPPNLILDLARELVDMLPPVPPVDPDRADPMAPTVRDPRTAICQ